MGASRARVPLSESEARTAPIAVEAPLAPFLHGESVRHTPKRGSNNRDMAKKSATLGALQTELDRRIRERARGPYSCYGCVRMATPVALDARDTNGCNWTVINEPNQPAAALPFLELIISQLKREYDLIPD
jgi:hypothetical protein